MAGEYGFEDAEQLLLEAEFQDTRRVWYSSNGVLLAQMCGPGDRQFAAIYKPQRGESPLWDFEEGTLYKREVAAYELSKLLGWTFVPPTVARDGPYGVGSLQVYIQHDESISFFEQREQAELVPQLQRMAVFDAIANNADRKGGHCLLDSDGRVWGIDHGLCFHFQYKLRTVIWDWSEDDIAEEWLADAERIGFAIDAGEESTKPLLALLSEMEAAAMLGRIEGLLTTRKLPKPGPHRHYPWPLV